MKKFIVIIAILTLIMVPASGAFAGGSNHHNNNSSNNASADADSNSSSGATAIINNNGAEQKDLTSINNRGSGYRGFANQAEIAYAPLPGYLGPARHDANVQSAKVITMFKNTFTRADVENLLRGVSIDSNKFVKAVAKEDRKDTDTVRVIFVAPDKSIVRQCAVITTKATSEESSSVNVLGAAILSALDVGADLLLVTAEGLSTELSSFGWGIGLAYSVATINNAENTSGIGSGGTGISGGKAGYKSFPWIQSIALTTK